MFYNDSRVTPQINRIIIKSLETIVNSIIKDIDDYNETHESKIQQITKPTELFCYTNFSELKRTGYIRKWLFVFNENFYEIQRIDSLTSVQLVNYDSGATIEITKDTSIIDCITLILAIIV